MARRGRKPRTSRSKLREQLIAKGLPMVIKEGPLRFKVDELCNKQGISKRTFYEIFESKEIFLAEVVQLLLEQTYETLRNAEGETALDQLMNWNVNVVNLLRDLPLTTVDELQKHYPAVWDTVIRFLNNKVLPLLLENIERGKQEGLYRKELDDLVIARFRMHLFEFVYDRRFLREWDSPADTYMQISDVTTRGMLTEKGMKRYLQILEALKRNETSLS
ncbi:MAG: TetR/AcrR family transcriptional regulator [Chlorobi bacterium]|nr:TetR/AcrR family transcriptional regulator [Chlorobiota bacterium]